MSRLSLLRICVIWLGMNSFWAIWKSIIFSVTHSLLAISYLFSLVSLWHNWFMPPPHPSTKKDGKGRMLCYEFFTIVYMFQSLQIMMHCYSGTSDISWAFHDSGNVMWHSMVVGYWCFRATYWSHLQGWSSRVMMKSRLTLLNLVRSNALALVDCRTQNGAMIASFWTVI